MLGAFQQAIQQHQYEQAARVLDEIPKNTRDYCDGHLALVKIYDKQGDLNKVLFHLRTLLQVDCPLMRTFVRNEIERFNYTHNLQPMYCDLADKTAAAKKDIIFITGLLGCDIEQLSTCLSSLLHRPIYDTRHDIFKNNSELTLLDFLINQSSGSIVARHVRCSLGNKHLVQVFAPKPIVLVQDIFEAMSQWAEHLRLNHCPTNFVEDLTSMSTKDLLDYVATKWGLLVFRMFCFMDAGHSKWTGGCTCHQRHRLTHRS